MFTAVAAASSAVRPAFYGRANLAMRCGLAAVDLTPSTGGRSNISLAVQAAMLAVVGTEAGLIGATFTSTHYDRMTNPIETVVTMPTRY